MGKGVTDAGGAAGPYPRPSPDPPSPSPPPKPNPLETLCNGFIERFGDSVPSEAWEACEHSRELRVDTTESFDPELDNGDVFVTGNTYFFKDALRYLGFRCACVCERVLARVPVCVHVCARACVYMCARVWACVRSFKLRSQAFSSWRLLCACASVHPTPPHLVLRGTPPHSISALIACSPCLQLGRRRR